LAPHSSALVAKIVAAAFPGGEFAVVQGGAETAQQLLACPFNHVFYVGNTQIGKLVMKAAADHCASVTLEMGGKNPSIVGASADIADTAMKTAWGRMVNGGQACIAPDYVLVHASVERALTEALAKEFTAQYNSDGRGFAHNPDYPVIINERHFNRVRALIEDARAKGATIVCGGEYLPEKRFVTPTIISKVTDGMKVMQEEIFGPVLCILPYQTKEDVTRYVAGRDKPLALYIFSKDQAEIDYHIAHTTSGSTMVNHNIMQNANPYLPFGGVNTSGIGRMSGWYTFNECSNARAIAVDGPALGDPRAFVPPFTDKFKRQVAGLLTQKPVPSAVVKLIHGMLRFKGRF
jgi:aldehyde dehydrogenase (NAD+)